MKRIKLYLLVACFTILQALALSALPAKALSIVQQDELESEREEIYVLRSVAQGYTPSVDRSGNLTRFGNNTWILKKVRGQIGVFTLRNEKYSQVDIYLSVSNGQLSAGPADPLDRNSQWELTSFADGMRISNFGAPGYYLHVSEGEYPSKRVDKNGFGVNLVLARRSWERSLFAASQINMNSPLAAWELLTPAEYAQNSGQTRNSTPQTVDLTILNNGFESLSVAAIDDPQNPVALADLGLGEQYVQKAYPGNQLGFASGGAWVGQPYTVTADVGQTLGFDETRTFLSYVEDQPTAGSTANGGQPDRQPQIGTAVSTVEVTIINNGFDSLSVAAIDDPTNPIPLADLGLGEQYVQQAYSGNQLGFASGGAWVGQPYTVTADVGQTLGFDETRTFVSYVDNETAPGNTANAGAQQQAQNSGAPQTVDLTIINNGFGSLSVAAIDDPQNPVALADLGLGEQYVQQAYPGNQLGFASDGAWVGQPYTVTADSGQTLGFDETRTFVSYVDNEPAADNTANAGGQQQQPQPQQQAQNNDPSTVELTIINNGFESLSVAAIDDPQNPVALADLGLGEQYVQQAYPGNQLGFASDGAWVGKPYTVTADSGQTLGFDETRTFVSYVDNDPAAGNTVDGGAQQSQTGGAASIVDITIINNGYESLSVASIDDPQNPVALADLGLGEQYVQQAYPGNQLGFASDGTWVGQRYTVTADSGQTLGFDETRAFISYIDNESAQIPADTTPLTTVSVLINNDAYELMTVAAVDDPENPVPLIDLPFGAHFSQEAYPGNVLGFIVAEQWLEDYYQVTNDNAQALNFGDGGQMQAFLDDGNFLAQLQAREQQLAAPREQGPNDATARFVNTTGSLITVSLIPDDPNGTPEGLFDIPPGEEKWDFAPIGGSLGFYNADSQQYEGEIYILQGYSGELIQIPWKDPNKRDVAVTNNAAYPLTVLALATDPEGQPEALVEIQPYATETVSVSQNRYIQAYDFQNQAFDGSDYQVRGDQPQGLTIPVRASGSVEVVMTNTSADDLGAQKVFADVNRETEFLASVAAGKNVRIYALPGETISFASLSTNEWVGGDFIVQSNPVQTISLPLKGGDADGDGLVSQAEIQTIASKIAQGIAAQQLELMNQPDRCWRNSYGRGVGKIPNGCKASHPNKEAGLCYQSCGSGYTGFAATCVQDCPSGYTSDGLISCLKPAPYERSAFVWKLGDTLFSLDDARDRCARSSDGKKYGCVTANADTIVYSGCPRGMKTAPVITSLCSPICPAGMTDSGIGCFKNNQARGIGLIPDVCGANRKDGDGYPITDYDAGLCYKQCNSGYKGVGPVCWGQCPRGWVNCGAGCAKDSNSCAMMISDQISSPLMVAGNATLIALTAGGAAAGTAAANAGKAAAKTAASTAAKLAVRSAAKVAIRAKVRAALKLGLSQGARAAGKAVAKDLAMDTAISAALVTTLSNVTDAVQREQIKEAVRQQVIQELEKGISDEQIDAAIEIAMEGADQDDGIANNFPWESLDPTGVAEVVVAYNNPLCATIKTE